MALVTLEGVFMAANPKTTTYDGKEKTSIYIDLYQQESEDTDKTVQIKTDDLTLLQKLNKEFAMGSVFKCKATVNAYKNKAYYKLVSLG